MTETKTMENPSNSVDVSELKVEEPTEMAGKQMSPKFGRPHEALDVSGAEMQYQENETGVCQGTDAANIDHNHDNAGSFTHTENNDFAEMPDLSHVLHNGFKSDEQAADLKSNIVQSGSAFAIMECKSSLDTAVRLEGHLNCAILDSSFNDVSVCLTPDAEANMGERSPSGATTCSDGSPSHTCLSGGYLEEESAGIVLSPDYLEYCGAYVVDSIVYFSRSSIEARGRTVGRKERTFHIHLDINDIVKIESQWSAQCHTGTLNICFILKCAAEDNVVHNATVSGLQELKFPVFDLDWYRKQGVIVSLNDRYKVLWRVLLDTQLENCSALPEGEAIVPTRSYFPKFDKPFDEVIYPKGDHDAVSISKRDVDLLLPDTFVNDTIIDFYIIHLKTKQTEEERIKFHFFNSFFFRKLADMDKDPSSAFDGKAAFQRVRKWTRKVNLLEKDFIFIPVNYNYHWSLIVICYLGEVASYEDVEDKKLARVPCVLHMDSFRGSHIGLKDLIQSYLWEEWKERQRGTCDDLYSKFRNLKFVPLELPQQPNLYDCGLFLLHYVERFLEEVPANFSIYKITPSSRFLQADWFPPGEASLKRTHIERLINDILEASSENCSPSDGGNVHSSPECPNAIDGYENGGDFSVKSGLLRDCHEDSLHQIGQGIEMTLLPSSSTGNNLCTTTSGLVLKDLFEQTPASESLNDAHWGSLEGKSCSLLDFKRNVPQPEENVEANDCFVPTELLSEPEPIFHHVDDSVTLEEHALAYSSSGLVPQPAQEDVDPSPVISSGEEMLTAAEPSQACDRISILLSSDPDPNPNPSSPNNMAESPREANRSLHHSSISAAFTCHAVVASNNSPTPPSHPSNHHQVDHEPPFPESNEEHAAKKMRTTPTDDRDELTTS